MADIEEKIKDKKIVFPKITLADLLKGMLLRRREEMVNQAVSNGFIEDVIIFYTLTDYDDVHGKYTQPVISGARPTSTEREELKEYKDNVQKRIKHFRAFVILAKDCLPPTMKDYMGGRFPMTEIYSPNGVNFLEFAKEFANLDTIQSGRSVESKEDILQNRIYKFVQKGCSSQASLPSYFTSMKELMIYATANGISFELKKIIYCCVKGFKDELEPIVDDYNKYCYHRDNLESVPPSGGALTLPSSNGGVSSTSSSSSSSSSTTNVSLPANPTLSDANAGVTMTQVNDMIAAAVRAATDAQSQIFASALKDIQERRVDTMPPYLMALFDPTLLKNFENFAMKCQNYPLKNLKPNNLAISLAVQRETQPREEVMLSILQSKGVNITKAEVNKAMKEKKKKQNQQSHGRNAGRGRGAAGRYGNRGGGGRNQNQRRCNFCGATDHYAQDRSGRVVCPNPDPAIYAEWRSSLPELDSGGTTSP